jgi:hypothetical protein
LVTLMHIAKSTWRQNFAKITKNSGAGHVPLFFRVMPYRRSPCNL